MKRYEIRWTVLDPTLGAEMAETRPAVIVSLGMANICCLYCIGIELP